MFNFVLISLVHPSRKICHLYLTYCVVVSVSGSCSTKCFWLCPLFHFPWKQLSHSKSPRVPRSHLTHQGTILAALRTFTWSFIVSSKNGRNSAKIRNCWISTYFKVRIDLFQHKRLSKVEQIFWYNYKWWIGYQWLQNQIQFHEIFHEIDFTEKIALFQNLEHCVLFLVLFAPGWVLSLWQIYLFCSISLQDLDNAPWSLSLFTPHVVWLLGLWATVVVLKEDTQK